ncbi:hypothetical protein GCM10010129_74400 [Streptomyces fumigatiscleroticus]|nr:hypothetical protein GCM10010129_74400 [Streptomyces fumigatiscleroticus]
MARVTRGGTRETRQTGNPFPGTFTEDTTPRGGVGTEAAMVSHHLEHGVLVVTVDQDPGIDGRARLSSQICDLVSAHRPAPVVIVLAEEATGRTAVSAVLRAHRLCGHLGVLMSVVTHSAPARRMLEDNAGTASPHLVVHARVDTAVMTAFAAAA